MVDDNESKTLNTTAMSIEILELLEEIDGGRVTEIAELMEAPKSTIHGHLATLKSTEFVIKRGDIYYLGPELLRLGNEVRTRKRRSCWHASSRRRCSNRSDSGRTSL